MRCASSDPVFGTEDDHIAMPRPGGRGHEQRVVAFVVQRVADLLAARPLLLGRSWWREVDSGQPGVVVEKRHLVQIDAPPPQISKDRVGRRKSGTSQSAVPRGPRRIGLVGEVLGPDGGAPLPAAVGRLGWLVERVGAVRDVPDEDVMDAAGVDVESGQSRLRACLRARRRAATRCGSRRSG